MNKEALLKVADALDQEQVMKDLKFRFRMADVLEEEDCGTAGCIMGMAVVLLGDLTNRDRYEEAQTVLGFGPSGDEEQALCDPRIYNLFHTKEYVPFHHSPFFTPGRAARAIRYFVNGDTNPWVTVLKEDKITEENNAELNI